jgi:hypothetical protein
MTNPLAYLSRDHQQKFTPDGSAFSPSNKESAMTIKEQ